MRGVAVLGILPVNAAYFAGSWLHAINPTLPPLDVQGGALWAWLVPHVVFEGKFITLFSMLFGVSVFLVGGGEAGEGGDALKRRLAWLAVFGVLHGLLIWSGDVLLFYAAAGAVLAMCRRWSATRLTIAGAALFCVTQALISAQGLALSLLPAQTTLALYHDIWAPSAETLAAQAQAFRGELAAVTRANIDDWLTFLTAGAPLTLPRILGLMMIGIALFKSGFFHGRWSMRAYGVCIAVGAASLAAIALQAIDNARNGFGYLRMYGWGMAVNQALAPLVALGYAAALVLIARARWLDALAAVGRMAFTNYIAQSVIMTTILWGGRGFGLYGSVDRETLMGIVAGVWIGQLLWSPLWLSRFRQGPLEALWRRLTYGAISRATAR
ncbi:MAG: DUF418 domain-containing protein [Hyphomonadaceae bacterium]|nr:DUF418 domain-containing protein [Hyphomonadaceae bacterium]